MGIGSYEVGTYWQTGQTQIDIVVACAEDRQMRLIEAKWKGSKISTQECQDLAQELKNKTLPLPNTTWMTSYHLVVSSGVAQSPKLAADVQIISLDELF